MNSADCPIDWLPNDVLLPIFQILRGPESISSPRDLAPCILVSRRWHSLAMPVLWNTIHLDVDWMKIKEPEQKKFHPSITDFSAQRNVDEGEASDWDSESDDWNGWIDYDNSSSPMTVCWGDIIPRPFYTNVLGVRPHKLDLLYRSAKHQFHFERPFWMAYSSPFDFCRKITICLFYVPRYSENKRRINSIVLACKYLRDSDIFLHPRNVPTLDDRTTWIELAGHLSSQNLRTLRIRLKWCNDCFPFSFNTAEDINQPVFSFGVLLKCLTHFSLELNYWFRTEPNFPEFPRLKFLGIYLMPYHAYHMSQIEQDPYIWGLLRRFRIEEMGFTTVPSRAWNRALARLPSTLTKLSIMTVSTIFDPMPVLKHLINLEILVVRSTDEIYSDNVVEQWHNSYFGDETIACHQLHTLCLGVKSPPHLFEIIAHHCPLMKEIEFPCGMSDEAILAIIDQCQMLETVTFSFDVSPNALRYLRHSKAIVNITLSEAHVLPKECVFDIFLRELPLLQHIYFQTWFEEDCDFHFEDLLSYDWQSSEVDQLRPYIRPDHYGRDFMHLNMRAMRQNYLGNVSTS